MLLALEDEIARVLPYDRLVTHLRDGIIRPLSTPDRTLIDIEPGLGSSTLLMTGWDRSEGGRLAIKLVNVRPENAASHSPTILSVIVLAEARTGRFLAVMEGEALTARRTAATSALAAQYLARPDSRRHLVIGAGRVASELPFAYRSVLDMPSVVVYNRTPDKAVELAARLREQGFDSRASTDLDSEMARADVISCATFSATPLVRGSLLAPGTHVDLVGSFRADMRESDNETIRAGRIFVDTPTAIKEAGDLVGPLADGIIGLERIEGDLAALARGEVVGRLSSSEITVFKSVGSAQADLAAAECVYQELTASRVMSAG